MSNGIRLDLPRQLDGTLSMAVSARAFREVQGAGLTPVQTFRWLSGLDMLIFVPGRDDRFRLYTHKGSFSVSITEEQVLLLTSYYRNKLRDNNDCLRFGVSVSCTGGFYISVKNQNTKTYCAFRNGREIDEDQGKRLFSPAVADMLRRCLDEQREQRHIARSPAAAAPEEHRIPEQMEEYLATAEAYAAIENDLELARAQQSEPLYYYGLDAVTGFDRQDRMAYSVRCDQLDETAYAPNTKVQIELSGDRQLGATILSADPAPEGGYTLVLLLEDQVSRSELPSEGAIRPTFSDVQYEVRSNVIDSLRQGKSKAGFLEQVLGRHQTAGFESKDLRALDAELRRQKYPPNASQIEAIHRGINTKDILLVMGPPGTGKTTVILEWVKYFIKQEGKRVLISSQNNKAVDNVLERLTEERDISAIRAGNEAKVQANMYPYLLENRIKQLQTELELHSGENLKRLERLGTDYQAYGELLGRAVGDYQAIDAMAASLEHEADRRCAPLIEKLNAAAEEEKRQRRKLDEIRGSLRPILFFMGDPDRAMVLRILTTPFRKLLRGKAEKLLARYEECYAGYREVRGRWLDAYRDLFSLYTDERLLDLAARQAQLEKRSTRWRSALARHPDDRDICGDLPWPDMARPMDTAGIHTLRQQLDARRQRVEGLHQAVDEWNSHIQSQSNYALSDLLLESADLVGGTCIGINSQRKFARVDFDVTIIDEAGQIQIHNALVPMSRSPKLIMLGDHKQIPPVADPEQVEMCEERDIDPSLLRASLFEALYERLPESNKIMLDTQYRMPAQLGDLLSEWFYDNKYYSFEGKRGMPGVWPGLFTSPFVVVDTSGDPGRREAKLETGASNPLEAELVARIVGCMTDPRDPNALDCGKFGVISPYKAQVEQMRNAIRKRVPALSREQIHEMVASLDSFQGQERKIIIYSCTRSNDRPPRAARIGFLKELRRLNVALSRPKEQLIFIGDIEFLSGCENGEGVGSERVFSQFIQLMMKHARAGGQVMTSEELCRKTGGGL